MKYELRANFAAFLICSLPLFAQAEPSASGQKPIFVPLFSQDKLVPSVLSCEETFEHHPAFSSEILSDTRGIDFSAYARQTREKVFQNWQLALLRLGIPADRKKTKVSIEAAVLPGGNLGGIRLVESSGRALSDRAAWSGVMASAPYPPLPTEFSGPNLVFRFYFRFDPRKSTTTEARKNFSAQDEPSDLAGAHPFRGDRLGRDVTPPHGIFTPEPQYTDAARKSKIEGTAELELTVTTEGNVRNVRVVRGLTPDLDKKAVAAVQSWIFEPATKNGKPLAVQLHVATSFRQYPPK